MERTIAIMNKSPVEIFYAVVFDGKFSAGKVKVKKQDGFSSEIEIMSIFHSRIFVSQEVLTI